MAARIRWLMAVSAVFAAGLVLAAQAEAAQPRLVCDTPLHDFGWLTNRDEVVHAFVLGNAGSDTLHRLPSTETEGVSVRARIGDRVDAPILRKP